MRIKKLSIRNLASIESADLDFEHGPLKEAPLFLICGETGAGKTTILDAITLALFGKTPRYDGRNRRNDCLIGGMAFNDARQLVRRGAAEASASVELVGNDGKTYEACWSVSAVTRGRNKGKLNKDRWFWKDCAAEYLLEKDLKPVVLRAVGLDFAQFCRTTLLAQGQFTKFLLGNEDDKAEILEKLTDTERFKRFGIAIGERYAALESKVKSIADDLANLAGLGPERPVVEAKVEELRQKLEASGKQAQSLSDRRTWLLRVQELAQSDQEVRADLACAFADLTATEGEIAAQLQAAREAVDEIGAFLAANESRAEMYLQAGVVLTELGYVRDARAKKAAAAADLVQLEKNLPILKSAKEEAARALEASANALDQESAKEDLEKRKLASMNLRKLRKEKDAAVKRHGDIKELGAQIRGMERLFADMKRHEADLTARQAEREQRVAAVPALEEARKAAAAKRDAAQAARDKVDRLLKNGIQAIVDGLHVGDECPICKSRIMTLNSSTVFSELMAEKDAALAVADAAYKKAEGALNAAKAAVDGATTKVSDAKRQIAADKKAVKDAYDEIQECAKLFGVAGTKEGVAAAQTVCKETIDRIEAKLAEGDAQERKIEKIAKSLKKLRKAKDGALTSLGVRERACLDCEASIKQAARAIMTEETRAAASLAKASALIAIPTWQNAWEQDPDGWEAAFKTSANEYRERKASLAKATARLAECVKSAEKAAACSKRVVEKVPELAADAAVGTASEDSIAAVDALLGKLAFVEQQRKAQDEKKPQELSDEDTVESLSAAVDALAHEDDRLRDELAAARQRIADDDTCAAVRVQKESELAAARAVRDEWKPIAELFGDQTGKKIQREIQSYVLANVLVKANYYLRQLSARYELSCEGLILSVVDVDEGCMVRPVNTLSGGEQFLVSLALALGLAGMNDSGLCVDMLLVDEGFGTLSGEHLNAAIEALERLNAMTGTRKVGVISHVERLRERIRTHVEVTRNGHEPSTVKVVSGAT